MTATRPTSRTRPALAVALAVLAIGLAGCGKDPGVGGGATPGTTVPTQIGGVQRADPLRVGAVELPEVTGGGQPRPFAFRADDGILLAYFGYTSCPDVCPTTLSDVRVALRSLGADAEKVDIAMVTVDPERDTPEILTGFLGHFFDRSHAIRTTDEAALDAAEEAFLASSSVRKEPDGRVEVSHTGTLYAVDRDGTVLVEWPFGTKPEVIASDLRILLGRTATNQGSVATPRKGTP